MAKGWTKYSKEKILKAIDNSGGNKLLIARRIGCARNSLDHYLDLYPECKKAYDEELESAGDLCEAQLMNKIKEGNLTAIIFYAKTKLRDRGYVERQEREVETTQPLIIHIDEEDKDA